MENYIPFLDTAVRAAQAAGSIQRENFGAEHDIRHKGKTDLVTEVDIACEEVIKRTIAEDWPKHAILAEETGASGKGDYVWIVDPLDGTNNYAHTYPHFCTSIALEERGGIVAGAVYDPMREELFTAVRGGGAYLNGKKISTSPCSELESAILGTGFPYDIESRVEKALPLMAAMLRCVQGIRRDGAAALNLSYVAAGRLDGFWEISLHAWDVAAGGLIVEEAGGKVTGIDGKPTTVYSEQIIASNGPLHQKIVDVLATTGPR